MRFLRITDLFLQLYHKMNVSLKEPLMPVGVRGMKALDREKFSRDVTVPVLKVSEEKLSKITEICRPYFLKLMNFKPVQICERDTDDPLKKIIYLNPEMVTKWTDIPEQAQKALVDCDVDSKNFETRSIQIGYDNWRYEQIFKSVLPENEESVSGFSHIGHIIHLNLRDHLLDYRPLIGQVLIDKIKVCKTVVNKSNTIDNTYRNFSMEVIAGYEDFLVSVKENFCIFQFDFSKVYWNPRLGKEHERILSYMKPGDVLFDIFCGVGPFAIPAAKRKVRVFANDLNPESFKWLNHNANVNKVSRTLFKSYNLDGKDFIQTIFKDFLVAYCSGNENVAKGSQIHITMNLPALAVQFLQYFRGLIEEDLKGMLDCKITVYVYCFDSKVTDSGGDETAVKDVAKEMADSIGCDMTPYITNIFDVRNVSPKKEMMRVTFNLTKEVLCAGTDGLCNNGEPPKKKLCVQS